ncbi:MAG TPA: hypothetical protein VLI71_05750 [Gammaproteobacteria bacterium]|nr:hypothetical protein [Gammaproteobacteria bacterium]
MPVSRKKRMKVPPVQPEHPWERQPEETDSGWAGFVAYRDLGPNERSLAKAALKIGKQKRNLEAWCTAWDWVARCAAFDAWTDRQAKLAELEGVREMKKRQIAMGQAFQGVAALALNKIGAAEKSVGPDGKPGPLTLKPNEVKELAELGAKLERLARGEPGEIEVARIETPAGAQGPIVHDYSNLTTEELRTLRMLTRKARGDV